MKYNYRSIPLTFSGTETRVLIERAGDSLAFFSSAKGFPIKVILDDNGNDEIILYPRQKISVPFSRFWISATGADSVVLLATANLTYRADQTEIYKDNSPYHHALAGVSFTGYATTGPVAGQYPHVQVFNASPSPVILALTKVIAHGFGVGGYFSLRYDTSVVTGGYSNGVNHLLGLANGYGTIRAASNAALLGTVIEKRYFFATDTYVVFDFTRNPFLIPAGYGVAGIVETVNLVNVCTFEWVEI